MRRSLEDIAGQEAAGRLADLTGYLETDPVQDGAAGGLVVGLGLVNDGDDEVPLLNPFVLVQFQVRNQDGEPLRLPTRPPPMLIHTRGGEDWSLDGPRRVVRVRKNGQAVDRGIVEGRVVRVAGREDVLVSFAIDRFVEDASPTGDPVGRSTPAEVMFPAGTYRVRSVATLIDAEESDRSRIVESGEIEIRYAAPERRSLDV